MLTAFRNFARSPAAAVLMGLLILAMAGFGISRYGFSAMRGDEVIKAGSRVTSSEEFRRDYDNYKKQLEQRVQQQITPEMAAANHLDTIVVNQVANSEAFSEVLTRIGVRPSDKLVAARLRETPAFFDAVTGQFDKKTYLRRLGEVGLTPQKFDQSLRDTVAAEHFFVGAGNGLRAPRAYGALGAIFGLETRDLAYISVTPQSVAQPTPPTDAQLTAFMNQHAAQLTRPEMRVVTVVRFTPQPEAGPVDEAELKKLYDFKKDTLSKPETRTLVQIPAKTAQAAQQITARLAKGEAPAAVAKAMGVEPIEYQDKPQTALPDKKLAAAVFRLPPGQMATVQGDLGLAVVKVLGVSPGREVTLDEARPMLEAEVRKTTAVSKVYKQTQVYDDAHQAGASLAEAAQKAGAATNTVGPLSQQGVDAQGQPAPGVSPRILEQAFSLPAGGESDLTEADNGEYFAVKVEKVMPPALPPLEELRPLLTREWLRQEVVRRMETRANELLDRLRKGESIDAVAASGGLKVSRAVGLSRQTAGQDKSVPREVLGRGFGAKPGEAFITPTQDFTFAVGQATNVHMDASPTAAQIANSQRGQMSQTLVNELMEAAQVAARAKLKVRVDPARARAAVGMEPVEPAAAPGKKK